MARISRISILSLAATWIFLYEGISAQSQSDSCAAVKELAGDGVEFFETYKDEFESDIDQWTSSLSLGSEPCVIIEGESTRTRSFRMSCPILVTGSYEEAHGVYEDRGENLSSCIDENIEETEWVTYGSVTKRFAYESEGYTFKNGTNAFRITNDLEYDYGDEEFSVEMNMDLDIQK